MKTREELQEMNKSDIIEFALELQDTYSTFTIQLNKRMSKLDEKVNDLEINFKRYDDFLTHLKTIFDKHLKKNK